MKFVLAFLAILPILAYGSVENKSGGGIQSLLFITSVNGKSYFVVASEEGSILPWTQSEASQHCKYFNMRLATIGNSDEKTALHSAWSQVHPILDGRYWLGARDERSWTWTDVKQPVTGSFNWDLQIPFQSSCLTVSITGSEASGFTLADRECDKKLTGILCETPN